MSAGAACVIFDGRGRVLLVKENYDRRRWSFPGGRLEEGEAPWHAAVRETREETGVDVAVDHLVGVYGLDNGFYAFAFAATVVAGEPAVPPTGEISELAWHDVSELPQPRSNVLHYALPDAIAGRRGVVRTNLPRVS